jgi:hypothetical protein
LETAKVIAHPHNVINFLSVCVIAETPQNAHALQAYDLEDVRESVRQGVTKVAGKISSLANGVMSSLQDRYGY